MPKELITPSNPQARETFVPAVGWTRDMDMQIAVQVADADLSIVDLLYGGEHGYQEQIGTAFRLYLTTLKDDDVAIGHACISALNHARAGVERDGLWATLDRRQVNDLIRSLRKARDAAYGRDE